MGDSITMGKGACGAQSQCLQPKEAFECEQAIVDQGASWGWGEESGLPTTRGFFSSLQAMLYLIG